MLFGLLLKLLLFELLMEGIEEIHGGFIAFDPLFATLSSRRNDIVLN